MTKKTLSDYIDACELIRETEEDIQRLKKRELIHDKVNGSNPEFPYQKMSFHISGVKEINLNGKNLEKEKKLLIERKQRAEKIKIEVDQWMNTVPARMQRIIRLRYFKGESWENVARCLGKKATADSVRKEFNNFFKEK